VWLLVYMGEDLLFNSYEFIFAFLPITFFIYFYLIKKRLILGAKIFLVFSSLVFYSWWNIIYLPLIVGSMIFNYIIGYKLSTNIEKKRKKTLLIFGIVANLLLLGYFKYADFFIENINYLFNLKVERLNLALPLAISFFTFQQISYLVDSYNKTTKAYNFLDYALFVTFFPQLIAGPIVHHKEMMPQFASKWNLVKKYKNIAAGFFIFSIGLFKKVVIADYFAVYATNGFDVAPTLTQLEAWVTSLSYTFQLYFDFSGYTDMAIGAALLFNIKLPINFNSPYKATSIQDFWRRWHITLSRFLKDYIYIPLGGNKKGSIRTYQNLMTTFIIGGLWHGAGWTFVFWGFLHGLALVIHRFWQTLNIKMNTFLAWFLTFNFINISWVFFRAKEWQDAIKVLDGMFNGVLMLPQKFKDLLENYLPDDIVFGDWASSIDANNNTLNVLIIVFMIVLFSKNSIEKLQEFKLSYKSLIFTAGCFLIALLNMTKISEFLYFNF